MDTETKYLIADLALNNASGALGRLYEKYAHQVYRYVSVYVECSAEADEIVSDCFYAVWKNRKTILGVENFSAYLLRIAKFKAIDSLRKKRPRMIGCEEINIDLFTEAATTPEELFITAEMAKVIDRAIEMLPSKCKLAFKLVREDRLSHKEAAELMDISVKTLQSHLSIAMHRIREVMKTSGIN